MYNKANVQLQNYNTGPGGSNSGEPTMANPALPTPELPPLEQVTIPGSETTPTPTDPTQQLTAEQWVTEAEEMFARTGQNPHQLAEQLSELRQRYHQTVLGLQQVGRDE
jgi:hypothetical protein